MAANSDALPYSVKNRFFSGKAPFDVRQCRPQCTHDGQAPLSNLAGCSVMSARQVPSRWRHRSGSGHISEHREHDGQKTKKCCSCFQGRHHWNFTSLRVYWQNPRRHWRNVSTARTESFWSSSRGPKPECSNADEAPFNVRLVQVRLCELRPPHTLGYGALLCATGCLSLPPLRLGRDWSPLLRLEICCSALNLVHLLEVLLDVSSRVRHPSGPVVASDLYALSAAQESDGTEQKSQKPATNFWAVPADWKALIWCPFRIFSRRSQVFQAVSEIFLWQVEHAIGVYGTFVRHDARHAGVSRWTQCRQKFHVDHHRHLLDFSVSALCESTENTVRCRLRLVRNCSQESPCWSLFLDSCLLEPLPWVPKASCPRKGTNTATPGGSSGTIFATHFQYAHPCSYWRSSHW